MGFKMIETLEEAREFYRAGLVWLNYSDGWDNVPYENDPEFIEWVWGRMLRCDPKDWQPEDIAVLVEE